MKKVIEKLNRVLAILLVAAMVAGSVPEMSLVARAEGTSSTDEANQPSDDGEATLGEAEAQGLDTPDADSANPATTSGEQSEPDDKTETTVSTGGGQEPAPTAPAASNGPYDVTCTIDGVETLDGTGAEVVKMDGVSVNKVAKNAKVDIEIKFKNGYKLGSGGVTAKVGSTDLITKRTDTTYEIAVNKIDGNLEIAIDTTPMELTVVQGDKTTVNANTKINVTSGDITFTVDATNGYVIDKVEAQYDKDGSGAKWDATLVTLAANGQTGTYKITGAQLANAVKSGIAEDKTVTVTATAVAKPEATTITLTDVTGQWKLANEEDSKKRPITSGQSIDIPTGKTAQIYATPNPGYTLPASGTNTTGESNPYQVQTPGSPVVIAGVPIKHKLVFDPSTSSDYGVTVKGATGTTLDADTTTGSINWGEDFVFSVDVANGHHFKVDANGNPDVTATVGSDPSNVAVRGGDGKYTINREKLKGEAAQNVTIKVGTYKYRPKVVFEAGAYDSIKYDVAKNEGSYTTPAVNGSTVEVAGDKRLRFKVVLKASETKVPYLNGATVTEEGSQESGKDVYKFLVADDLTDDCVFELRAAGGAIPTTTKNGASSLSGTTITYLGGCVKEGSSSIETRPGVDIKFSLELADADKGKKEIDKVVYTSAGSGGKSNMIIEATNGVYTIPSTEVKGDITITVTLADLKANAIKYKVTFKEVVGSTGVDETTTNIVVKDSGNTTVTTTGLEVAKDGTKAVNAVFTVEPGSGRRVVFVSTTNNEAGVIRKGADGKYTVPVTRDTTIYVATEATTSVKITQRDAKKSATPAISDATAEASTVTAYACKNEAGADAAFDASKQATVPTGEVTLTLTPATNYKVVRVMYGATGADAAADATAADGGTWSEADEIDTNTYLLKNVAAATSFIAYTTLDDTKTGVYKITLNKTSGVGTIKVGNDTVAGTEYLTTSESELTITVEAAANYEIDKITKDNATDDVKGEKDASGKYTLKETLKEKTGRELKLNITAVPAKISGTKTVTMTAVGDRVSYKVTNAPAEYNKSGNDYTLVTGVRSLKFDVEVLRGTPDVKLGSNALTKVSQSGNTYSYEIPAGSLSDTASDNVITITGVSESSYFTIASLDDDSIASVDYIINGVKKTITGPSATAKHLVAEVGDTIEIVARPSANCEVGSITMTRDGKTETNASLPDKSKFTFEAKAEKAEIEIAPVLLNKFVIKNDDNGSEGTAVDVSADGVYDLEAGKKYHVMVVSGTVTGTAVAITDKALAFKGKTGTPATTSTAIASNKFTITTSADDAGKTLTLSAKNGGKAVTAVDIRIKAVAASITVGGKKNPTFEVEAGRTTEYTFAVTPKDALNIDCAVTSTDGTNGLFTATIDTATKKLTINAPKNLGMTATIKIKDKATDQTISGGEITVVTKKIATLVNAKPSVKLVAATGDDLYIEASGPALPGLSDASAYYYWVVDWYTASSATTPAGTKYIPWTSAKQNLLVNVGGAAGTEYKVEARLIYSIVGTWGTTNPTTRPNPFMMESKASARVSMKTRTADIYETNLGVAVKNGTVYTGQKNVEIAIPVFGKNTSKIKIVKVEDVTESSKVEKFEETDFTINNDTTLTDITKSISLDSAEPDKIGRHTIKIWAEGASNTYGASKTMTLNVLKGIESVELSAPGDGKVYKAENKTATLQTSVKLNGGEKADRPAKATVAYSICSVTSGAPGATATGQLASWVKVSGNGRVSIAKDTPDGTEFYVKAEAKDYTGSTAATSMYSGARVSYVKMEVTQDKLKIGRVVIVDGGGNVLAKTETTVAADELGVAGAKIAALHEGVTEKTRYSNNEMINADTLTFKSSNAGALLVAADGSVTVKKPGTRISVTVTANDGSKTTAKIEKLAVTRPVKNPGLLIKGIGKTDEEQITEFVNATVPNRTYNWAGSTYVNLSLATDAQSVVPENNTGWYKYTVKVSGATVVHKSAGSGQPDIIMPNAKETKITFTDNDRKDSGKTFVYTLVNNAWKTEKAPKVTVSGVLAAGRLDKANYDNTKCNRTVTIKADGNYKYAYVAIDGADYNRNQANKDRYNLFNGATDKDLVNGALVELTNGAFSINFTQEETVDGVIQKKNITKGNYKLTVTYGESSDANGVVVPSCKAVSVTVKAETPAAAKFTPASSYKMSTLDTPVVKLTGKETAGVKSVNYVRIENKNTDGTANSFTGNFELDSANKTLAIKDSPANLTDKKHLKGYIIYTITDIAGYTTDEMTKEISITISDKKVGGFTVSAAKVVAGATSANVKVMRGGAAVKLGSVTSTGMGAVLGADEETITLTPASPFAAGKKYTADLTFIPKGGTILGKTTVTVTISVENGATSTGKISVTNANVDMTTGTAYEKSKGDGTWGSYTILVPYNCEKGLDAKAFERVSGAEVSVAKSGQNIKISVNRSKVTKDAGSVQGTAGKVHELKVKATFDGAKEEVLTLKVKYPAYVPSFDEIVAKAESIKNTLSFYDKTATAEGGLTTPAITCVTNALGIDAKSEVSPAIAQSKLKATNLLPTSATVNGKAYIEAVFTDLTKTADDAERVKKVEFEIDVIKVADRGEEIAEKIKSYNTKYGTSNNFTNKTTVAEVRSALEAHIGMKAGETLTVTGIDTKQTTDEAAGHIKFNVKVTDTVTGASVYTSTSYDDSTKPGVNVTILQLKTLPQEKDAVDKLKATAAWTAAMRTITESASSVETVVTTCVRTVVTNPDVVIQVVPKGDNGTFFATVSNVKKAKFVIELTNPKSAVNRGETQTVYGTSTNPIEVTVGAVKTLDQVKEAIEAEMAKTGATDIKQTIQKQRSLAKVEEVITEMMNEQIGNSGVEGKVTDKGSVRAYYTDHHVKDVASTTVNGQAKYEITLTKAGQTKTCTIDVAIPGNSEWQTMDDLANEIEWLLGQKTITAGPTAANVKSWIDNTTASSGNPVIVNNGYTVAVADRLSDYGFSGTDPILTYKAPTGGSKGRLEAKFKITKGSTEKKVTDLIGVDINMVTYTLPADTTAMQNAVKDAVKASVKLTNEDNTSDGRGKKKDDIITAAKGVLEPKDGTKYTVTGTDLTIKEATGQSGQNAGGIITLTVKETTDTEGTNAVTVNLTPTELGIDTLDLTNQTIEQAAATVAGVLDRWDVTAANITTAPDAKTAIEGKVANLVNSTNYDGPTLAKPFGADGLVFTAPTVNKKGSLKFTLFIKTTDGKKSERIDRTLEIAENTQSIAQVAAALTDAAIRTAAGGDSVAGVSKTTIETNLKELTDEVIKQSVYAVLTTVTKTDDASENCTVKIVVVKEGKKDNVNDASVVEGTDKKTVTVVWPKPAG